MMGALRAVEEAILAWVKKQFAQSSAWDSNAATDANADFILAYAVHSSGDNTATDGTDGTDGVDVDTGSDDDDQDNQITFHF